MTQVRDAGFTLIESLVALAVLALSAVTLLGAVEAHIARIGALETRAAADWVTQNHLAELVIGSDPATSPEPMLGFSFQVAEIRTATADPSLLRVDLSAEVDGRTYGRLTGFLDIGTGARPDAGAAP